MYFYFFYLTFIAPFSIIIIIWISIGRTPRSERLKRIRLSKQWHNGSFTNVTPVPVMPSHDQVTHFAEKENQLTPHTSGSSVPKHPIPVVKTDLNSLDSSSDVLIWLGHSSLFLQLGNLRILVDPILTRSWPMRIFMPPFPGSGAFSPDDIPPIDFLLITHDHWDHLDYLTLKSLQNRIKNIVCPLGVGEHLEYWGLSKYIIHELDWKDSLSLNETVSLHCLPSQHFSGRFLKRNQTLWCSYLLEGPKTVFISGDGGYASHFAEIGQAFPQIDVAVLENGQYNLRWPFIHLLPHQLPQAADDLGAKRVLTYHHGKYRLSNHDWDAPLETAALNSSGKQWSLLTPCIGETVHLDNPNETFPAWWRTDSTTTVALQKRNTVEWEEGNNLLMGQLNPSSSSSSSSSSITSSDRI